jgi:putative transposase
LIRKNADLSVRRQCELLGINHSSVYTRPSTPNEDKRLLRETLMARLDYWHTMLPALGSRKLAVKLQEEGYQVGRKLVRRLMREMGIWAVLSKAKPVKTQLSGVNCTLFAEKQGGFLPKSGLVH